jgi:hypothetical protein
MTDVAGIRIDEGLADILQRLKKAKVNSSDENKSDEIDKSKDVETAIPHIDTSVNKMPVENMDKENAPKMYKDVVDSGFVDDTILPWFTKKDKDLEYLHFLRLDENGSVEQAKVKANEDVNKIAALKLKDNYLCDLDYYKSKHFVLYVQELDSDYYYSRSYIATNESVKNNIVVEDTQYIEKPDECELKKVPTEDLTFETGDKCNYNHYVVFTDLGIADFIAKKYDVPAPLMSNNLDKWFETVSNTIVVENPNFESTKQTKLSDEANSIEDYKYNIITMARPGIFILDSADNSDAEYQLTIKLKDEYSFIPIEKVLICLKKYSTSKTKSIDDFKRFINTYFDIA